MFFFNWPTTQHIPMSKDNRHDGRRRGAGQHRLGPRNSQGGDGRERSGSNSSGSSHGGGRSKNPSLNALKVCEKKSDRLRQQNMKQFIFSIHQKIKNESVSVLMVQASLS